MERHLKTIELGKETLYRLTLESEPCVLGTQKCRFVQFELLRYIAEDPAVTACGTSDFHRMTMKHDGSHWIVEAEAIVKSQSL